MITKLPTPTMKHDERHNAQRYRQTDRQTDRRHHDAKSPSYCVQYERLKSQSYNFIKTTKRPKSFLSPVNTSKLHQYYYNKFIVLLTDSHCMSCPTSREIAPECTVNTTLQNYPSELEMWRIISNRYAANRLQSSIYASNRFRVVSSDGAVTRVI